MGKKKLFKIFLIGLISFISFCMYSCSRTSEILENKYHTYKNDIINETLQEKNVDKTYLTFRRWSNEREIRRQIIPGNIVLLKRAMYDYVLYYIDGVNYGQGNQASSITRHLRQTTGYLIKWDETNVSKRRINSFGTSHGINYDGGVHIAVLQTCYGYGMTTYQIRSLLTNLIQNLSSTDVVSIGTDINNAFEEQFGDNNGFLQTRPISTNGYDTATNHLIQIMSSSEALPINNIGVVHGE